MRITGINFCTALRKFCPVFVKHAGADEMLSTRPDLEQILISEGQLLLSVSLLLFTLMTQRRHLVKLRTVKGI